MHWQAQLLNEYVITQQGKEIGMDIDLFQMQFCLNYKERRIILAELERRGLDFACCSACDSKTDIAWLRKKDEEPLHHAMCVPCFLRNTTNLDQDLIDRMVKIGQAHGFYKDEPVAQPNWEAIMNYK